jgi:hypothetical protein
MSICDGLLAFRGGKIDRQTKKRWFPKTRK